MVKCGLNSKTAGTFTNAKEHHPTTVHCWDDVSYRW